MPGAAALPSAGEWASDAAGCSSCHVSAAAGCQVCGVFLRPGVLLARAFGWPCPGLRAGSATFPWPGPPQLRFQGHLLLDGISETLPTLESRQREFSPAAAAAWTGQSFLGPCSGRALGVSRRLPDCQQPAVLLSCRSGVLWGSPSLLGGFPSLNPQALVPVPCSRPFPARWLPQGRCHPSRPVRSSPGLCCCVFQGRLKGRLMFAGSWMV